MADPRPRPAFGLIFHPKFPPETLADYAQRAEAAGFDELWLWDDCFLPGAFTSAAIALSATQQLKVGIGLLPVPAYNPLFAAMEITTLASAFPGRFLPGFGHGVARWMAQIGATPRSSLKALDETVTAVRQLLSGEMVTMQGDWVHLDQVQMQLTPEIVPPLYVGAVREKTLRLAGRVGDGTILTVTSSPAYIRWALSHDSSWNGRNRADSAPGRGESPCEGESGSKSCPGCRTSHSGRALTLGRCKKRCLGDSVRGCQFCPNAQHN